MDRLERLLNLVAALLDAERPLLASEIAARVAGYPEGSVAFRRAFERDKDTLRSMDIPLTIEYLNPGDPESGQGYRIPRERYQLPDPGLEPEEVAALHLAATSVQVEGAEATAAIWKLGGVGASSSAPVAAASLPGSEHLGVLFGAVAERRPVEFQYRGEPRTLDPWRLGFRGGFWYVSGWDHARADKRTFRLDRLASSPVPGPRGGWRREPEPEPGPQAPPWEMGDEEPVVARVLVDAGQERWAVAAAGDAAVEERRTDGSVVLSLRVTNRAALRSFVLGLLDHAELLSPPQLRDEMVEWLRRVG